jgi:hypothetical protein
MLRGSRFDCVLKPFKDRVPGSARLPRLRSSRPQGKEVHGDDEQEQAGEGQPTDDARHPWAVWSRFPVGLACRGAVNGGPES